MAVAAAFGIKPTYAYIGRCPRCNGVTHSVYDMVDDKRTTAKAVQEMIAKGRVVERVPLESVELGGCACSEDPTAELPLFEQETSE